MPEIEKKTEKQGYPTYQNPLIENHADPDILFYDGVYYLYATSREYDVYSSQDLVNWTYRGKSLPGGGWGVDKHYWAPDVEYINGKFYMAVSFGEDGFGIAVADSPLGPFVCQGEAPLLKTTIDGHLFVDNGKVYLYYTSWYGGRSYGIYGVEMSEDMVNPKWETEVKLISPTEEWEKQMGHVVEAPYMLKHNGLYYLLYSGSHTASPAYAVGYAVGKSPLGPFVKSEDSPILKATDKVHGPAHCCVVTAPDRKTMVIVYHCHGSLERMHPRHTCIDKIAFVPAEDGIDRLVTDGPTAEERSADWLTGCA